MAPTFTLLAVSLAVLTPLALAQSHIRCQNTIGGPCGDSSRPREMNCCDYGYCQPWNSGYYQCKETLPKCPNQETDIDYYGNDLKTIYGLSPADCCETCSTTSGCAAYTFVNENKDGRTACYLKTSADGRRERKGAVSALYKDYKPPACTTALWGGCGSDQGTTCCPDGAYCQPWNTGYYQCIATPSKCPAQETDVDYYGNDLKTVYGLSPAACCDTCTTTSGCAAYTFVNQNKDGKTACYLKTSAAGRVAKKGAVSAVNPDYKPPTCANKLNDGCGNAQTGAGCCPDGAYCQPWNQWYYQCIKVPAKCPDVLVGVDLYGDDLRTIYGLLPVGCCNVCSDDSSCVAYTFVNENADGRTACYLKKGEGVQKSDPKVISGIVRKKAN